jgi:hypothetical protein
MDSDHVRCHADGVCDSATFAKSTAVTATRSPGPHGVRQPVQGSQARREKHHDEPHMCEIERGVWEWIGDQVVAMHLHPIAGEAVKEHCVEVDSDQRAASTDAVGQHPGDRAGALADIQAGPPLSDAERVELPGGQRVVVLLEQAQPRPLGVGCVVPGENVVKSFPSGRDWWGGRRCRDASWRRPGG